jgi:hypothetical protein
MLVETIRQTLHATLERTVGESSSASSLRDAMQNQSHQTRCI